MSHTAHSCQQCWCVGREVEPPPADLESTEAVKAQRQWPFGRLGHPCDRSNSRESGEPYSPSHCVALGKTSTTFCFRCEAIGRGRGGEDLSHLGTLLTEEDIESAHRQLNARRRDGSLLHEHYALHFGLRHLPLPATCCRVTRLCDRATRRHIASLRKRAVRFCSTSSKVRAKTLSPPNES